MARISNVDLLARQRGRVNACKKWRREEGYDDTWKRLIDMYRGKQYEYASSEDRMAVNISLSTVNIIAPSVAVNYPKIAVNARKPEAAPTAIITEAVVNYWWKRYKVRPQFRRAVKDFLVVGHGWLKVGYRYVEEDKIMSADEPSDGEMVGNEITPTVVVVADRPFVERVSPFDVFVDPDATSMEDALWIAQRIRRPMKAVKADKRYSKAGRDSITARDWGVDETDPAKRLPPVDKEADYVEVWEFYDIAKNQLSVFCSAGEHFLIKPTEMPYAFGHPFIMVRNYDVPDFFYPLGDLEAIEPLQRELNETRTQMMNHRKRYARKFLYKAEAFDPTARRALESDVDNEMVAVQGDYSLNEAVIPMPVVMTPPEFYQQSEMIQTDVQSVSGVSEYMRGSLPEIRRTATEAAIVQDASNARAADKLATIEQAIAAVAECLVQLGQQFVTEEQVARIVGKDGKPIWLTFDKHYIAGEFDFEVEAGSTAPNNESFRRQMALQMVDALAPFVQLGVIDPSKLATHVLQFGFSIKNPESFLRQGPPPGMDPAQGGVPPEGMPPGGVPPQGMPGMPQEGPPPNAPPQGPEALSGIDPGVLAALSSRFGMTTENL